MCTEAKCLQHSQMLQMYPAETGLKRAQVHQTCTSKSSTALGWGMSHGLATYPTHRRSSPDMTLGKSPACYGSTLYLRNGRTASPYFGVLWNPWRGWIIFSYSCNRVQMEIFAEYFRCTVYHLNMEGKQNMVGYGIKVLLKWVGYGYYSWLEKPRVNNEGHINWLPAKSLYPMVPRWSLSYFYWENQTFVITSYISHIFLNWIYFYSSSCKARFT